jgi:hypothetical protein
VSDPRISDEVVELASAASWNCQLPSWWVADGETAQPIPTWDAIAEEDREPYRVTTRAALEAAVPLLAPQPVVDRAAPATLVLESADALRAHLDGLNESGVDFKTSGMDSRGQSFLAYLDGPYAESLGVLMHNPWDSEIEVPEARMPCDDCGVRHGPLRAEHLAYPVTVLALLNGSAK